MIPVVTPDEMKAIDLAAPEPVEVLVGRAGAAVARAALRMLGGGYGRRVVVVAGKGNNGADGREAARRLARRGVRVTTFAAAGAPATLPASDLVIDAAYGTGFRGDYEAPDPVGAPVLAVDVPSGVDGLTGEAGGAGGAVLADATVTFAALKPGLLLGEGPERAGRVELVDIGLDVSSATVHVVETADVSAWLPRRRREAHKWQVAVWVCAGTPGMTGAARLCARAALRSGAGSVRVGSPGLAAGAYDTGEAIAASLPADGWAGEVLADLDRFGALVLGPGLGRSDATASEVRRLVAEAPVPVVLDADGLFAVGKAEELAALAAARSHPLVLTPHEGEFARLAGAAAGPDRLDAVRDLARRTGAVVLLKGSTTLVAEPGGRVLVSTTGGPRLATAGTGDVLAGAIAAFAAAGVPPLEAAAAAAHVHGLAAHLGWRCGLVAGDVADHLPAVLSTL